MFHPIAILADDLTSALDGGAAFAARGGKVSVQLSLNGMMPRTDIVSFDLDSRFDPPDTARTKAENTARFVAGARVLFKTMDSTLRGNILAETSGTIAGSGRRRVIAAPAFPDGGRVTRNGRQWVQGVPVAESDFSRDVRSPVTDDRVESCFAGLDADVEIHDAETNADLDAVVADHADDPDLIWVGSPGLAAALARYYQPLRAAHQTPLTASRVLVVIGSLHSVNRNQIDALMMCGAQRVIAEPTTTRSAARLTAALSSAPIAILATNRSVETTISPGELARKVAEIVGACQQHFNGLVVSGGDTARRIVDHLNGSGIRLIGETEPGIPVGMLTANASMPFITKAGGFGGRESLVIAARHLLAQEDNS